MSRFTVILIVILAIPVILVGALFFLLSNPDYYRDQITKVVREQAGYELTIKGDISWRYFPPVALNVDQLDVRLPGAPEPLAALKSASIDLALWPLVMDGKVAVNGLSASGITVNAIVGKDGKDNWTVASAKPAEKPEADTGPADFDM
ncbi:MAG: AsmA family protein, partial [Pseudomonadales bacterium]|nr:AsmA family protein [Pseudomonadales bacterium]